LRAHALDVDGTVRTGDWVVLAPSICTISASGLANTIKPNDPLVTDNLFRSDHPDEEGCYLDRDGFLNDVAVTRGVSEEEAYKLYEQFLAASILAGDFTFFSDSPLSTPVGFQSLVGHCASVPQIDEIRRSHAFLVESLDPLIRRNARYVICDEGTSILAAKTPALVDAMSGGRVENAWLGLELQIIVLGLGWQEGASLTERGTPRPPVCHFAQG
jgi:hypothetical protein